MNRAFLSIAFAVILALSLIGPCLASADPEPGNVAVASTDKSEFEESPAEAGTKNRDFYVIFDHCNEDQFECNDPGNGNRGFCCGRDCVATQEIRQMKNLLEDVCENSRENQRCVFEIAGVACKGVCCGGMCELNSDSCFHEGEIFPDFEVLHDHCRTPGGTCKDPGSGREGICCGPDCVLVNDFDRVFNALEKQCGSEDNGRDCKLPDNPFCGEGVCCEGRCMLGIDRCELDGFYPPEEGEDDGMPPEDGDRDGFNPKEQSLSWVIVVGLLFLILTAVVIAIVTKKRPQKTKEPSSEEELTALADEKKNLEYMIDIAKSKYHTRKLDEESFREIVRDRQNRIIEIEARINQLKMDKATESEPKDSKGK